MRTRLRSHRGGPSQGQWFSPSIQLELTWSKNVDTDEELKLSGEPISFYVPDLVGGSSPENDADIESSLDVLVRFGLSAVGSRQQISDTVFVEALQEEIYKSLERRIDQVRNWATVNVARFPPGNQDVRNLLTKINGAAIAMRAAIRICSAKCSGCQLLCLRPYRHANERHRCGTNHRCVFDCAIAGEHTEEELCALP